MTKNRLKSFCLVPNFNISETEVICDKLNDITREKPVFPCKVILKINEFLSEGKNIFVTQWEWDRSIRHYPGLILKDIEKKILFDPEINSYQVSPLKTRN